MKQETISRRKMLKALAAAGGAVGAASFLPAKWLKPIVQSGVLPAHAAASLNCTNKPVNIPLYDWDAGCGDSTVWVTYNSWCSATPPADGDTIEDSQYDGTPYTYTYKASGVELYSWDNPGPGYFYLEEDPTNCN